MIQKSYDEKPKLYIVPTPIGNLEDITLRALNILKKCDIILAEDTRTTNILLKHYNIKNKLISNHLYNEDKVQDQAINLLKEGKNLALVSDAGTPIISDPGYILVNRVIKEGFNVICLPGATAIIPAVVMSNLAGGPFTFFGFLNSKQSKRIRELESLKEHKYPIVFYESPHRITTTLKNMLEVFGDRKVAIVREISKKYEEIIRDKISKVIELTDNIKGEIVIVIDGNREKNNYDNFSIIKHIELYLEDGLSSKEAIKKVAKERNLPKSDVYKEYINYK